MVHTSTDPHSLQILGVDLLKVCITSIPCILCVLSVPCIPCISCIPYILCIPCIPCIPCIFCIPCIPGIPFIPCIPWHSPLSCILYPFFCILYTLSCILSPMFAFDLFSLMVKFEGAYSPHMATFEDFNFCHQRVRDDVHSMGIQRLHEKRQINKSFGTSFHGRVHFSRELDLVDTDGSECPDDKNTLMCRWNLWCVWQAYKWSILCPFFN